MGSITVDPVKINDTFKSFFKTLYSSEYADINSQTTFLDSLYHTYYSEETQISLDIDITEEITEAIDDLTAGRHQGQMALM